MEPHAGKNATPVSPKISKDDDEFVVPLLLRGVFVLRSGLADDDFETDGRRQRRREKKLRPVHGRLSRA